MPSLGEQWGTIPMFCPWSPLDPSSKDAYLAGHRDSQVRCGACVAKDGIDQVPLIFFHQGTTPATCRKAHQSPIVTLDYLRWFTFPWVCSIVLLRSYATCIILYTHITYIYSYHNWVWFHVDHRPTCNLKARCCNRSCFLGLIG